jgi:hypothetical protein
VCTASSELLSEALHDLVSNPFPGIGLRADQGGLRAQFFDEVRRRAERRIEPQLVRALDSIEHRTSAVVQGHLRMPALEGEHAAAWIGEIVSFIVVSIVEAVIQRSRQFFVRFMSGEQKQKDPDPCGKFLDEGQPRGEVRGCIQLPRSKTRPIMFLPAITRSIRFDRSDGLFAARKGCPKVNFRLA